LDDHWIHDHATVVNHHQLFNGRRTRGPIDADHGDMGPKSPRLAFGIKECRLLQAGLVAGWDPAAVSGSRDRSPVDAPIGDARYREAIVNLHDVLGRSLQQMAGDAPRLLDYP